MHDKMDYSKTACFPLARKMKGLDGFLKLLVKVSRIFAHGHGNGKYADYNLDAFQNNNFTVGSIAKLLRNLEDLPTKSLRSLFRGDDSTKLYQTLFTGSKICLNSLGDVPLTPLKLDHQLSPVLYIQIDNSWRKNKNMYVFCLWSFLVARRIVKEAVVSFMIVGHTHNDLEVLFGQWSMKFCKEDHPTLSSMMQSYMKLKKSPFIPHLIEEVPDFKAYIKPYSRMNNKQLMGHSNGRQYKFFIDNNGWLTMQYKLACIEIL